MFAHRDKCFSTQHSNGLDDTESVLTARNVEQPGLGEPTLYCIPVFRCYPSCHHILRWLARKEFLNAQILVSSQPLQELFTSTGILDPLLLHIVSAANESYNMGRAFLFPLDTSPCLALPDTLFLYRDYLRTYGQQDFASTLETDDNLSATNSPNITTPVYVLEIINYISRRLFFD